MKVWYRTLRAKGRVLVRRSAMIKSLTGPSPLVQVAEWSTPRPAKYARARPGVRVCVCVCVRACGCVCVCVWVGGWVREAITGVIYS